MKPLVAMLVAGLFVFVGADGYARPHPHAAAAATKRAVKKEKRRARRRTRVTAPALAASQDDELVLAPAQVKQLERNLIDGGYMTGTVDGRLTHRVRKALAEFQREYHMPGTGTLDRATAQALLGYDAIPTATVAARTPVAARPAPSRKHRR